MIKNERCKDFYNLQMLNSGANEEKNYTQIDINQKDIAWEVDRNNNYKRNDRSQIR